MGRKEKGWKRYTCTHARIHTNTHMHTHVEYGVSCRRIKNILGYMVLFIDNSRKQLHTAVIFLGQYLWGRKVGLTYRLKKGKTESLAPMTYTYP